MMKSEWDRDPITVKADIQQRLIRLFGRFDQQTEKFAAKPSIRFVQATLPLTNDPKKATTSTAEIEPSDGPQQLEQEQQPGCSASRFKSNIDVLLKQITFVEPLISPIRSDTDSRSRKRPLCVSPDDASKRPSLKTNEPENSSTRTEQQHPVNAKVLSTIKLKLTKANFLLLQQRRESDKKSDMEDNMDSSTSSAKSTNSPGASSDSQRESALQSLEKWTKEEGLSIDSDKDSSVADLMRDSSKKEFLGWLRESLGTVRVSDIKPSGRQSEHPFMITISADMGAARHMLRITEIKEMEHLVMLRPVLHVNFFHPVVTGLMRLKRQNVELASEIAVQVYENALCTAGLLKDTSKMVGRLNKIFAELLQLNAEKSQILTP